jgi:hypothetical protein
MIAMKVGKIKKWFKYLWNDGENVVIGDLKRKLQLIDRKKDSWPDTAKTS